MRLDFLHRLQTADRLEFTVFPLKLCRSIPIRSAWSVQLEQFTGYSLSSPTSTATNTLALCGTRTLFYLIPPVLNSSVSSTDTEQLNYYKYNCYCSSQRSKRKLKL